METVNTGRAPPAVASWLVAPRVCTLPIGVEPGGGGAKGQDWSGAEEGRGGDRGRGWGKGAWLGQDGAVPGGDPGAGLSPPLSPAAPELPPRAGSGQNLGWGHGWPQRLLERPCTLAGTLSALLGRLRDVPGTGRRDHAAPHGLT